MVSLFIMELISVHTEGKSVQQKATHDDDLVTWTCLSYQTFQKNQLIIRVARNGRTTTKVNVVNQWPRVKIKEMNVIKTLCEPLMGCNATVLPTYRVGFSWTSDKLLVNLSLCNLIFQMKSSFNLSPGQKIPHSVCGQLNQECAWLVQGNFVIFRLASSENKCIHAQCSCKEF